MNVYHFHPETGEFVGVSEADPSPLEPGKFLIPAFATTEAPPKTENKIAVWSGSAWVMQDAPLPPIEVLEPEPPLVPRVVTMRQARRALLQQGLLANVETAMQLAGQEAQIDWEYAQTVEADSPLVGAMRDALGLTDDDVLGLFAIAGGL